MKNFDSRTYSINDFVEWERQDSLVLNPSFQRRPVWSEKAKGYLIDTILRGKPVPKFFIRQKINVTTRTSVREVVDGQQRLRTILSYLKDGFAVSRRMNPEYGGKRFSQLPADAQAQFLSYEIAADLLINMPDSDVLDIFSRLNSYAVILNEQEKLHAIYFGPFKALSEQIGHKYHEYWLTQGVFSDREILRMKEVNLVADLLIALMDGIKSKKQIKSHYIKYERNPESVSDDVAGKFDGVVDIISSLFPEGLKGTEFSRPFLFYTLFTAVAHSRYGIPNLDAPSPPLTTEAEIEQARNRLDRIGELFAVDVEGIANLSSEEQQFLTDSRRATTDETVRVRRTKYILGLLGG